MINGRHRSTGLDHFSDTPVGSETRAASCGRDLTAIKTGARSTSAAPPVRASSPAFVPSTIQPRRPTLDNLTSPGTRTVENLQLVSEV